MAVTKVQMPKLSEAMESGKIIKWLKKEGDRVQSGDILAEVETDKADVEMEAFGSGVLRTILVPAGEKAPVGALIGVIAEPSEDIAAVAAQAGAPPAPAPSEAASPEESRRPAAVPPQPRREDPAERSPAPSRGPAAPARPMAPAAPAQPVPGGAAGGRVKASPLARKIAAQSGVDLKLIQGRGPGGRIVRRDVEAAGAEPAAAAATAGAPARVATAPGVEFEDRPLTPMRAAIAKRMPLSKAPVPHFYVTSEIAMDQAWELREQLN
ncbi:MAG TPA: biotin/lipoyl-containing protein, partial [Methylomirabilota bacterium]|nr:biotin/lipoyl-containing protein [Methylomirabilota bacterium]